MIKVSNLRHSQSRIVRETSAPFIHNVDGEEITEQIRVRYFSLSVAEAKEFRDKVREKDDLYLSDILLPVIESLPDFVDDEERPIKITAEVLESLNSINLRALQQAIEEHLTGPKTQPSR